MLLSVQGELRFGESKWLRAAPAMSLVIAHVRGKGTGHVPSPARTCAHTRIYFYHLQSLFRSAAGLALSARQMHFGPGSVTAVIKSGIRVGLPHPASSDQGGFASDFGCFLYNTRQLAP